VRRSAILVAISLIALSRPGSAQTIPSGYKEQERLVVFTEPDSFYLTLWADARLTPSLRDSLWGVIDACGLPADAPLREYCGVDLDTLFHPAILALLKAPATVVGTLHLTKPRASLASVRLPHGANPEVFVTEDDTPDFGSYRGPLTRVLVLSKTGPMRWAQVREVGGRTWKELRLVVNGKAHWEVGAKEILSLTCQPIPVADSVEFRLTLSRLRPVPDGWERVSRTLNDFWEADMGMPPLDTFPLWPGARRSNYRPRPRRPPPTVFQVQALRQAKPESFLTQRTQRTQRGQRVSSTRRILAYPSYVFW
jgi:hypothetical protein